MGIWFQEGLLRRKAWSGNKSSSWAYKKHVTVGKKDQAYLSEEIFSLNKKT